MVWNWIKENAEALLVLANFGTLFVWLAYAQLLFAGFRRKRKARVVITRGWGSGFGSLCLVTNLSEEFVYVLRILMTVWTDGEEVTFAVTDYDVEDGAGKPASQLTRQGTLQPGASVNLGTFHELTDQIVRHAGDGKRIAEGMRACEICVICIYGPEDAVIGAVRRFKFDSDEGGNERMSPELADTRMLTSRRSRKMIERWLRKYE
jgi:hypothetical protein